MQRTARCNVPVGRVLVRALATSDVPSVTNHQLKVVIRVNARGHICVHPKPVNGESLRDQQNYGDNTTTSPL